ncbi:DUF4215 domain-containing protein [Candidatus Pacearchaeota archaeon]|nr:DUF4215 domain-containing protein [Candidatus Pacearchaeota archaeon]
MNYKIILSILAIFLISAIYAISCVDTDALGDNVKESLYNRPDEPSLQEVLNDEGYSLDADNDQTQTQIWIAGSDAEFEVKYLGVNSAKRHHFGYYFNGDLSSFVELFDSGVASVGNSFTFSINSGDEIGFAIKTYNLEGDAGDYATENSLNSGVDRAVVYENGDEFILGLEDWGDYDYQDLVVSVKFVECSSNECLEDVSIRYSYGNSYGTGIAIRPEGSGDSGWIGETPANLDKGNYELKYFIDNHKEADDNVHVVVKLDENILSEYDYTINEGSYHYKTVDFNTEQLCGTHTLSLEVQNNNECDMGDNYAERDIYIQCQSEEPVCGNRDLEPEEQCDFGALNGFLCWATYGNICNYCTSSCKLKTINGGLCGDGIRQSCEECDDGNTQSGDGCSETCRSEIPEPVCGNNILEEGEQCDDNNNVDGDGCSALCEIEAESYCGDNNIDPGEQCDDGNVDTGDGCSDQCVIENGPVCGNEVIETGEQCDEGHDNGIRCDNNDHSCDYCTNSCQTKHLQKDRDSGNDDDDNDNTLLSFSSACEPNWECSAWSQCNSGIMRRACIDTNECLLEINKPGETTRCAVQKALAGEEDEGNNYWLWVIAGLLVLIIAIIFNFKNF